MLYYVWIYPFTASAVFSSLSSNITGTFACPNDVVTYTCTSTQTVSIRWIVTDYNINIGFGVHENVMGENKTSGNFVATLVEVVNRNGVAGDVTSTLTLHAEHIANGTIITCDSSTDGCATLFLASKCTITILLIRIAIITVSFRCSISSYHV